MKRWMSLLVLLLLLTGCAQQGTAGTDVSQPAAEQENTQQRLVNAELPEGEYASITAMGGDLLLMGDEKLVLVSGQTLEVLKSAKLDDVSLLDCDLLQANSNGLVCYDRASRNLIFLNADLQEIRRILLREEPMGTLQLAEDQNTVYYCTAEGIRVQDLNTGICRTLAAKEGDWQGITQLMFDESVLCCSLAKDDGSITTFFVSALNGNFVQEVEGMDGMLACGDLYFCRLQTEGQSEWIYGWKNKQPRNFTPKTEAELIPLLEGRMVVTVEKIKAGSILYGYNLGSGRRAASVKLSGVSKVTAMTWLDGSIYFLGDGEIYCWDYSLTPTADEAVYMSYRYTEDDPDRLGMLDRMQQAKQLEDTYGVNLILWSSVTDVEPQGFDFAVEHVPENYDQALAKLDEVLSRFPSGFFAKAGRWTESGRLNIVLVQQIDSTVENTCATSQRMQYLLGSDSYIVLAMGDSLEQSFYHAMGHVVDAVVMSNSTALYDWSELNPARFQYDNDYVANQKRTDTKYLEEKNRYFISTFSMSYPVEDRATILEYALMPGNEAYFTSAKMQKKLQTMCDGIREAFELKGTDYAWEQYLPDET